MQHHRHRLLAATLVTAALFLTGCSDEDLAILADFARSWGESHGVVDSQGRPDYLNIGLRALGGSTGDDQADAVIDAGLAVDNFEKAEKLEQEGYGQWDIEKVETAIEMRPGEFRYRNDRAALLIYHGRFEEADQELARANELVQGYGKAAQLRSLDHQIHTLDWRSIDDEKQKAFTTRRVAAMRQRYELTGDPADLQRLQKYEAAMAEGRY